MLAISLKKHNRKIIVSTLDVQFRMIDRKNGNEFHLMLKCQLTKKTHCTFNFTIFSITHQTLPTLPKCSLPRKKIIERITQRMQLYEYFNVNFLISFDYHVEWCYKYMHDDSLSATTSK